MRNRYVLDGGYIKNPKEHFKKMLEELIEEEKQEKQEKIKIKLQHLAKAKCFFDLIRIRYNSRSF